MRPPTATPRNASRTDHPAAPPDHVIVGRLGAPYGVRGWLHLHAFTDAPEQWRDYIRDACQYSDGDGVWQSLALRTKLRRDGGLIACVLGSEDRDSARRCTGWWLAVQSTLLPVLSPDEYYWHQLEGLQVWHDESRGLLGCVECLQATGANDVLVVQPCAGSIDRRRRLVPWVPGPVVREVDLAAGRLLVEWDPDF